MTNQEIAARLRALALRLDDEDCLAIVRVKTEQHTQVRTFEYGGLFGGDPYTKRVLETLGTTTTIVIEEP